MEFFYLKLLSHIQGAPVRDSNGGAVPDRIPCLKVKLLLPNYPGGTASGSSKNQASPDVLGNPLKKVIWFSFDVDHVFGVY